MTTTFTVGADDPGLNGPVAREGAWFRLRLSRVRENGDRYLSAEEWRIVLDATGAGQSDVPDAVSGVGLWIDSSIQGWQAVVVAGYPATTQTLVSAVNGYQVDPSTLQPLPAGSTALELIDGVRATANAATQAATDAHTVATGAATTAGDAATDAADAKSTADDVAGVVNDGRLSPTALSTTIADAISDSQEATGGALVSGSYADWAVPINAAFVFATEVHLPAGAGDLPILTTVFIPGGSTLTGAPGTRLVLADGYSLTGVSFPRTFGGTPATIEVMVTNAVPTSGVTAGCTIRDLTIQGNRTSAQGNRQGGIVFADASDCVAINCQSDYINYWAAQPQGDYKGFGFLAMRSSRLRFENCRASYGGYENMGMWETGDEIDWINCYCGPGWRTSFQIHRGWSNVRVDGLVIRQTIATADSGLTIHGSTDLPIIGVSLRNVDIVATVQTAAQATGGLQFVDQGAQSFSASNVKIKTNNSSVYIPSTVLAGSSMLFDNVSLEAGIQGFVCEGLVNDLHLSKVQSKVTGSGRAININPLISGTMTGLRIQDCDGVSASGTAFRLTGSNGGVISKPVISGNRPVTTGSGIIAGTGVAKPTIYGNDCSAAGTPLTTSDSTDPLLYANRTT